MNLTKLSINTAIPQYPSIVNNNNDAIQRNFNLIYDENAGIVIVPVSTTGRVKGSTGEFVTAVVDNLVVKNQFTNMYDNNTTADYNWYKMITDPVTVPRDPCTASTWWPYENFPGYKVIDVNKPYYRVTNEYPIVLANNNLSQVVGIFCASTLVGSDPFTFLMDPDPCSLTYMTTYTVDPSYAGIAYIEFIATKYDASWGSTWDFYKYAFEGTGGGSGSGGVVYNPALDNSIAVPSPGVGGIVTGTTVYDLRGKTLQDIISDILFPTVEALIYTARSLAFTSGTPSGYAEPSTMFAPTITAVYNPGVIHNGDNTTGPNVTGNAYYFKFKLPSGTVDLGETYAGNSRARTFTPTYIGNAATTYTWTVDVSYSIGTGTYTDNKGVTGTNLTSSRVAATISASSSTVTSRNKRFWGVSALSSLTSAQVLTLDSSEFTTTYTKSTFVLNPLGKYVYYCYPSSISGTPAFTLGGLPQTAIHDIGPVAVTNNYGHRENYTIYRSDTVQAGSGQNWAVT